MKFKVLATTKAVEAVQVKQGARVANPQYREAIEAAKDAKTKAVLFECEGAKVAYVRAQLRKAADRMGVNIDMKTTQAEDAVLVTVIPGKLAKRASSKTVAPARSTRAAQVEEEEDDEDDEEDDEDDGEDEDGEDDEE